jgi:hypothetical protein
MRIEEGLMSIFDAFRSKLENEAESQREELTRIVNNENDNTMDNLQNLAVRVGASIIALHPGYGGASMPELVQNIHQALQTKAMIAAVRTTSNYVIVTIILALIAFGGMVANIIMAFKVK